MKTLLLLRHAKSSWDNPNLDDHDRPLNERGLRTAPRMGRLLASEDLVPDLVLSSTAERAATTAKLALEASGARPEVRLVPELYLASARTQIELLGTLDERYERVMLVGHNPGLEELLTALTGVREGLPTAALARVALIAARWVELPVNPAGELVRVWRPKQLPAG